MHDTALLRAVLTLLAGSAGPLRVVHDGQLTDDLGKSDIGVDASEAAPFVLITYDDPSRWCDFGCVDAVLTVGSPREEGRGEETIVFLPPDAPSAGEKGITLTFLSARWDGATKALLRRASEADDQTGARAALLGLWWSFRKGAVSLAGKTTDRWARAETSPNTLSLIQQLAALENSLEFRLGKTAVRIAERVLPRPQLERAASAVRSTRRLALLATRRVLLPQLLRFRRRRYRRLVEASGLFDPIAYRRDHPWIEATGLDPLEHYLKHGWREGCQPGPAFDAERYLMHYPDVRAAGVNPLLHYLVCGKAEGRRAFPAVSSAISAAPHPSPTAPSESEWRQLFFNRQASFRSSKAVLVDVIVPVYGGREETLRCLYSVLSSRNDTAYELVVVDDHGPDQRLRDEIAAFAKQGLLTLVDMGCNQGFVAACNKGMAQHPERDVILLNSDTEVFDGWIDRMRRAAYSTNNIATVTPFSNNAEICSYPRFARDNWRKLEIHDRDLDQLAAEVNVGRVVDIPTGVGFCMYIRRACLDQIGMFDVAAFGRGYGEENDFCRRAAQHGWRNLLAADVFVRHYGGVSFAGEKPKRIKRALRTIAKRHPDYLELVRRFIAQDPIKPLRAALDIARMRRQRGRRGLFLFVAHDLGGGTEVHIQDLARRLECAGAAVMFCRPITGNPDLFRVEMPSIQETPNIEPFSLKKDIHRFVEFLIGANVSHIHVHSFVGYSENAPTFFLKVATDAKLALDVTIHDYAAICPRITLVDGSGAYCGEPPAAVCASCLRVNGSPFGEPAIWEWQDRYRRLLSAARAVFVPNEDVLARLQRHMPTANFLLRPHPEDDWPRPAARRPAPARPSKDSPRRVLLLGAIGVEKGAAVVEATVRYAAAQDLPLRFVLLGRTDRDENLRFLPNIEIKGSYERSQLFKQIEEANCDLAWMPSIWPETYSYVLSELLSAGLFPVVFDIGAPARRLRDMAWGCILPLTLAHDPKLIAKALVDLEIRDQPASLPAKQSYKDIFKDYYSFSESFDADKLADSTVSPSEDEKRTSAVASVVGMDQI